MQVLPLAAFDQEGSDTLYGTCEGHAGILTLLLEGATDAQQPQDVRKLCGTCEMCAHTDSLTMSDGGRQPRKCWENSDGWEWASGRCGKVSPSAVALRRLYHLLVSFRPRFGCASSVTSIRGTSSAHTAELAGRMRADAVLPAATVRLHGALTDSRWSDARACLFTLCTLFTVRGDAALAQQCDSLASLLMGPLAWRSQSLHFPGALLCPPSVRKACLARGTMTLGPASRASNAVRFAGFGLCPKPRLRNP
jgi:hypothetical protein